MIQYKCVFVDLNQKRNIRDDEIEIHSWTSISLNPAYVSDIMHDDNCPLCIKTGLKDSFMSFVKGRILLIEKYRKTYDISELCLNISHVFMSNGNEYYVLK